MRRLPSPAASPFHLGPERVILDNAMQPFLFRASGGELMISSHDPFQPLKRHNRFPHQARQAVSYDQGQSWQPIRLDDGPVEPYLGNGVALPDGRFLWTYYYAYRDGCPAGPHAGEVWWSSDGFRTFRGPEPLELQVSRAIPCRDDGNRPVDIICLHRSVVAQPDGGLLACAYCWFEGDDAPCDYLPASRKTRYILIGSTDGGRKWDYVSTIAVDGTVGQEGFCEPTMARIAQGPLAGRLLCLMRTGSAACPIYEAHSDDHGLTWSTPRPTHAVGVDPCLLELADGRLAFSWGTRLWDNSGHRVTPPGQAPTFKLCLSSDGGQHWSTPVELPRVSPSTGIGTNTGYSALAEVEPGHLLMTYDIGSFGDPCHRIAARDIIINPAAG